MKKNTKSITCSFGEITNIDRTDTSVTIELASVSGGSRSRITKELFTLANPSQADGITPGDKVCIFLDEQGRYQLLRKGEWKAVSIKQANGYEAGYAYIYGTCRRINMCVSENGRYEDFGDVNVPVNTTSKPNVKLLFMSVETADRAEHSIGISNYVKALYTDNSSAIENTVEYFKDYLGDTFVPFEGVFIFPLGNRQEPRTEQFEFEGKTYTKTKFSYWNSSFRSPVFGEKGDYARSDLFQVRRDTAAEEKNIDAEMEKEMPVETIDENEIPW